MTTRRETRGRRSDATFWRDGTQAEPGYWAICRESRWRLWAGWKRAAFRLVAAAVLAGLAYPPSRNLTAWALALTVGPWLGLTGWRAWLAVRTWRHRRDVVAPLAEALSPSLEMSPEETRRALDVPLHHDHEGAVIEAGLPDGWQGHDGQRETATRIVGHRLGGEWISHVQRAPLALVMRRRPEPPGQLAFAQVADLIRDEGAPMRLLMGLAAGGEPYWLDLQDMIVNLGVSVGTGGGKSSFLRLLIAQAAYWGAADFPVIDTKMVSLAGMTIPGVRVYDDIPEQWQAIEALAADVDARYRYLKDHPGYQFPLCMPLLEEQNDFAIASRAEWAQLRSSRDPATPPIYQQLTRIPIKGRQVGYRTIGVYQRLTAEACGGISAPVMRDAYGGKALARHSQGAWESLTGIRPWVPPSDIPGRWVMVTGGKVTKVQVPRNEAAELVEFVMSSPHLRRTPLERPWASEPVPPGGVQDSAAGAPAGPHQRFVPASSTDIPPADATAATPLHIAPRYLTQAEVAARLGMNVAAFVKWRQRCAAAGAPLPEPAYFAGRPGWTGEQLEEIEERRTAARRGAS